MKIDYSDITSRLGEPLWYDEYGVPRYELFSPDLSSVYGDYVAYLLIACQGCGKQFKVAVAREKVKLFKDEIMEVQLPTKDDEGWFCYGDPPLHNCIGSTMISDTLRILEFWVRDKSTNYKWKRKPEYEYDYCSENKEAERGV